MKEWKPWDEFTEEEKKEWLDKKEKKVLKKQSEHSKLVLKMMERNDKFFSGMFKNTLTNSPFID